MNTDQSISLGVLMAVVIREFDFLPSVWGSLLVAAAAAVGAIYYGRKVWISFSER